MGTEGGHAEPALLQQTCMEAEVQGVWMQTFVALCRAALLLPALVDYPDHFGPPSITLTDPQGVAQALAPFW